MAPPTPHTRQRHPSLLALVLIVLTNAIPAVGLLWLGWDAGQLLVLFWCESVIVGLFTLPRIVTAQGIDPPTIRKGVVMPNDVPLNPIAGVVTFVLNYGAFCVVHGMFLNRMVLPDDDSFGFVNPVHMVERFLDRSGFAPALVVIAATQLLLLATNWFLPGTYRVSGRRTEMSRPYVRVVALHLGVMFGGWMLFSAGAPGQALLILCAVKAAMELWNEVAIQPPIIPAGGTPAV